MVGRAEPVGHFLDTNILLYTLSSDMRKADCAERLLGDGAVISVQVLNEATNVLRRRFGREWSEVHDILSIWRRVCRVVDVTYGVHEDGLRIAQRFRLSVYDAMIVAAAEMAGASLLYTEDMHAGLVTDGGVLLVDPFKAGGS